MPDPAHTEFQKKLSNNNNEYRQNAWTEAGLCPILPITITRMCNGRAQIVFLFSVTKCAGFTITMTLHACQQSRAGGVGDPSARMEYFVALRVDITYADPSDRLSDLVRIEWPRRDDGMYLMELLMG